MKDTYLDKVLKLADIAEPILPPSSADWIRVEEELNLSFPKDVKELISALGSGYFSEFRLLNPRSSAPCYELSKNSVAGACAGMKYPAEKLGLILYPARNGLVPIGAGSNRTNMLLKLEGDNRLGYNPFWLDQDGEAIHKIHLPLAQFLHDLYLENIDTPWAAETRSYIWGDELGEPFFTQQPIDRSGTRSMTC